MLQFLFGYTSDGWGRGNLAPAAVYTWVWRSRMCTLWEHGKFGSDRCVQFSENVYTEILLCIDMDICITSKWCISASFAIWSRDAIWSELITSDGGRLRQLGRISLTVPSASARRALSNGAFGVFQIEPDDEQQPRRCFCTVSWRTPSSDH